MPFCKDYFIDLDTFRGHIGNHLASRMGKEYNFPNKSPSIPESDNPWENNELARRHLIDSFLNIDGFSLPFKKGKSIKPKSKDLLNAKEKRPHSPFQKHKPSPNSNIGTGDNHNLGLSKKGPHTPLSGNKHNSFSNIGTGENNNLGIKERKYKAEVFATRYKPDVDVNKVKLDLELNLLKHTGDKHNVEIEKLQTKYSHYTSFKITCFCAKTAVFMNSNIWPAGTLFKWWYGRRNNS